MHLTDQEERAAHQYLVLPQASASQERERTGPLVASASLGLSIEERGREIAYLYIEH